MPAPPTPDEPVAAKQRIVEPKLQPRPRRVAVFGNPNVGKTTLFNRLAAKSAKARKTSNFPGTTQEAHLTTLTTPDGPIDVVDLPGLYGLTLHTPESSLCRGVLEGSIGPAGRPAASPDTLLIVLDATNLTRSLTLARELLATGRPAAILVNRIDDARRRSIHIDPDRLEAAVGVPVLLTSGKTGEGIDQLTQAITAARISPLEPPASRDDLEAWADTVYADAASAHEATTSDTLTDRLDRAFTHPVLGIATFALVMTGLFYVIFKLAGLPMDAIDGVFAWLASVVATALPDGLLSSLLTDGVIAGVGGTVIFLPQILLLFFLIALLEDTGYLARAAFVIDRLLRPFGLPGHAFVPLLSAHACAIPAIMSARAVPDRRDRIATILAIPFMSCSARIPVYVLLTALLFPQSPGLQAIAFTGCYALGAAAGLVTSLLFRRTILRGKSLPMALELPSYRIPSIASAAKTSASRGLSFLKKAGTTILAISIVLWWLSAFPRAATETPTTSTTPAALVETSEEDTARRAAEASFLGRIGNTAQPLFAPLGADRQLTVGILASFAAREVFVSTMAVQVAGTDDPEAEGVFESLASTTRSTGEPVFNTATSWAMLVYFVLAMQCLPTLVVTAREAASGSSGWKWAAAQFAWMSAVAYAAGAATFAITGGWS